MVVERRVWPRCEVATELSKPSAARAGTQVTGGAGQLMYRAATSSLFSRITTLRLSLRLGVSCPPSSVHSPRRMRYLRIDSALETALLASSTAASISARRSGSSAAFDQVLDLAGLAVLLGPGGDRLAVEGDQGADEGLTVADDQALVDQGVGADPVLEHRRGDVLAARGDQDLLLAPGDPDEALVVDLAHVTGVEPAVALEHLGGRGVVLPVAGEDLAALEQQLAVLGDPDLRCRGSAGRRCRS